VDANDTNIPINNIGEEEDDNVGGVRKDYTTILTFIEGALVGMSGDNEDE
jgi:hypothetical protein